MTTPPLTVHGFETSNNMKVRIALGYKGIPYVFRTIDPSDREQIVRISGQYLTPVIEHRDVVLFDSGAILRYLETAFPETPRLFGDSVQSQWEIEDWELFAKTRLAGPMMRVVHAKIAGETLDDSARATCTRDFAAAVDELAGQIGTRAWVVGESMTAADVHAAAILQRVRLAEMFELPLGSRALDGWRGRVLAFDGVGRS